METCSSGEDLLVKARKPYTITKQRERWTDEEHGRFLEALKLYGRAWQRIEEHVGTKTAIQIRSHAQKFFTKLEKEALNKGLSLRQAHGIVIPPPRPKRKPNIPYPRKTCLVPIVSSGESGHYQDKDVAHSEKEDSSTKRHSETELRGSVKEISEEDGHISEVLTLPKAVPCASSTSVNKSLGSVNFCQENLTRPKDINGISVQGKASHIGETDPETLAAFCSDMSKCTQEGKCAQAHGKASFDNMIATHVTDGTATSFKKQAMHCLRDQVGQCEPAVVSTPFGNSNREKCGQPTVFDPISSASVTRQPATNTSSLFVMPSFAAFLPSIHQVPGFPSCTSFHSNKDVHKPIDNISPAFSDLIISTLQQNPAVHAAARLAASFWPGVGRDIMLNSSSNPQFKEVPPGSLGSSSGMAATVAATVAAATAWWAMHGLLPYPYCHPFPAGFSFAPPSAMTTESKQTLEEEEAKDNSFMHMPCPKIYDAQMCRHPTTNLSQQRSSDTDECRKYKGSDIADAKALEENEFIFTAGTDSPDNSKKTGVKKKQDRSSCGSNTTTSSDDTDIMPNDLNMNKDEIMNAQVHLQSGESNTRRSRSGGNINESWKEVSEEGRLAFQALFSREVLPQSFSPLDEDDSVMKCNKDKGNTTALIDLNSQKGWIYESLRCADGSDDLHLRGDFHSEKSVSMSVSGHGKPKIRRMGFKPYKRCSTESKEMKLIASEENCSKRIRMEDETSN